MIDMIENVNRLKGEIERIMRSVVLYDKFFVAQECVSRLNQVDMAAFSIIQRAMHDEIVISLSRLLDRGQTCGSKNLSLKGLGCSLDEDVDFWKKNLNVEGWRNKLLSHNDMKVFGGTRANVSDVVHGLCTDKVIACLNFFYSELCKSSLDYMPKTLEGKVDGKKLGEGLLRKLMS